MEATIPTPKPHRMQRKRQRARKAHTSTEQSRPAPQSPHTATGDVRAGVLAMRAVDPDATASEIAAQLGVSRARIGQLLRKLGLPTITPRSVALWGRPRRSDPPAPPEQSSPPAQRASRSRTRPTRP